MGNPKLRNLLFMCSFTACKQNKACRDIYERIIAKGKSKIKMQLLYFGVEVSVEFDNDHWSHAFRGWIYNQLFNYSTGCSTMSSRMRSFRFMDEELRDVSSELRAYYRKHYKEDYYLLRSVPGIGGIVAVGILSELGDLRRFGSLKDLAGYVGLAPGLYESGGHSKSLGMNPRCHRLMRSYFVEASWQAIRTDPVMQLYYRKHLGKDTKKIIVKVAYKLLSRTLAVIKTGIHYEIGIVS
tara:strand:+ start:173 stop:889 length:717 start_codon:yes stop_codon:yes gene_type:complete